MFQEILKSCKFIISLFLCLPSLHLSPPLHTLTLLLKPLSFVFHYQPFHPYYMSHSLLPLKLSYTPLFSFFHLCLLLNTVSFVDFLFFILSQAFFLHRYMVWLYSSLSLQSHSPPHFLVLLHFPLAVVSGR